MIDDQPTGDLFAKYLEPLNDWEPFALSLPGGITQLDVDIIKTKGSSYLRMEALHKKWLQVNPTASWRDVINALKQCKENELARTIEDKVTDPTEDIAVMANIYTTNPADPMTGKELNMAAVTMIFTPSATHCMLIGAGLNVKVSDLMPIPEAATTNLIVVFERWFDTDKDVNWDTLLKLCNDYPDQLGKAKSNLLAYIGKILNQCQCIINASVCSDQ
ncbi:PREDICTED: uncharacterized protein LOC109582541 [Amphimedon queenslandica]|uniref:Death domain-containing protein n=1 Tax=Amphimedon queenslandica TaxID=400682 RepID=A0AAN0J7Z1_AMPQE|nr:PREDICTED: uncharacterized protein LOC109582541 [Amphimedon queenslandica]|eukprot:XP_019852846.1 PREDICTED: uncharacterized protein LOC109582541 [Amphimedon queenslandica]